MIAVAVPSRRTVRPGWLGLLSLVIVLCSLGNCRSMTAAPTATPVPTPDEHSIYLMMTQGYTSWEVLYSIHQMSQQEAARILRALEAVQPPEGLEALHQEAVSAYQYILGGKLLLPTTDNLVRAEAYFMVDWGIALLTGYRERVDAGLP